jgi:fructokinase
MGGTKTSCGVGSSPDDLSQVVTFPTTDPAETVDRVIDHLSGHDLEAVGIASFGPVELRQSHGAYGHITVTPKHGWSDTDVVGPIQSALDVPVGFDTDVNGAVLGEWRWGAGQGLGSLVYVTVGTGIGGGALIHGAPIHGLGHPELGHIAVRRHPDDDHSGSCRLHGDCLEGLASGPAIESRFGATADRLTGDLLTRATDIEAFYLAQMTRDLVYTLAPERIIIGGGVSRMPGLLEKVGESLLVELAGYPGLPEHESGFVVPPGLGPLSGLAGGLILAERAVDP